MIKILFFIDTTLASGGAEKVLRELVNNMDQSQFEITVHTLWKEDAEKYLAPGIRYRYIFDRKTTWNARRFQIESALGLTYGLHLADDYDIEVAYLEYGPTKVLAGSSNKKAKKVAWIHCNLLKEIRDLDGFVKKTEKWYSKYDQVVCVSQTIQDGYRKLFADQPESVKLYNTVDDTAIRRKAAAQLPAEHSKRKLTVATIGRLYPVKGYDRLMEAHLRLIRDGVDHDLWILGEGPERPAMERYIADHGLENSVHLLGFHSNPYPFMREADVIVCSSYSEGFSTMVTEALILGKPVVTTPCSGMDELLGDSEFGLITADSTEGIYEGLKKMLDDPALRKHYADAAAVRGEAFSKEKLVGQTEQFFRSLLKNDQK